MLSTLHGLQAISLRPRGVLLKCDMVTGRVSRAHGEPELTQLTQVSVTVPSMEATRLLGRRLLRGLTAES
jgi:hypothetical protein